VHPWRSRDTSREICYPENTAINLLHSRHISRASRYSEINKDGHFPNHPFTIHDNIPISIHPAMHPWPYSPPFVGPWPLFQFLNPTHRHTVGRTPWTGDQPVARPLPTHRTTQTQKKRQTDIHALSGIRTHDPSVWASEDSSWLRLRGYCDQQCIIYTVETASLNQLTIDKSIKTQPPLIGTGFEPTTPVCVHKTA
jgi:hypothetical protein